MSPVNYYARCNPSPLAGVAQGVVQPGDTVPAGKSPPGQARGHGMPCPFPGIWPSILSLQHGSAMQPGQPLQRLWRVLLACRCVNIGHAHFRGRLA